MNLAGISAAIIATCSLFVSGKVFLRESFDTDNWNSVWRVPSKNTNALGSWEVSAGRFYADEQVNRGLKTLNDMHLYAITAPLNEVVSNQRGDFIVQFSAKNEQSLNCGGAYIKVLGDDVDVEAFSGQTPYKIMFGPDVCGANRRVHLILDRDGLGRMIKKEIDFPNDELTHMYTLVLNQPKQSYRILIDGKEVAAGNIVEDIEDMSAVPPQIPDESAQKPADWVDEAQIPDPEDRKPEDWEEGQEWTPRMIDNPDFKGIWTPPMIPNPAYKPDPSLALYTNLAHVGFDLWQVKAGTIFDNVLVTDDMAEAQKAIDTLFTPFVELENAAYKVFSESSTAESANESSESNESNDYSQQNNEESEDQLESDSNDAEAEGEERTDL